MATTFSGMYIVSYGDGEITLLTYIDQEVTLSDSADGADDHMVKVGDEAFFEWNGVTGTMTNMGYVSCLGPVMSMGGATYWFTEWDQLAATSVIPVNTSHVLSLCFVGGTEVDTPEGPRAVEDLAIGDMVTTTDGRAVPIKWVGRQDIRNLPWMPAAHEPIRISKDALAPGVPSKDLFVSPDHGMVWDDMIVNAGTLVNGRSVKVVPQAELPNVFTYFHVETEEHDIILANGAPTETFIDYAGRQSFDNYDEYVALYGCERLIKEQPLKRISARRQLPDKLRARLGLPQLGASLRNEAARWHARLSA